MKFVYGVLFTKFSTESPFFSETTKLQNSSIGTDRNARIHLSVSDFDNLFWSNNFPYINKSHKISLFANNFSNAKIFMFSVIDGDFMDNF